MNRRLSTFALLPFALLSAHGVQAQESATNEVAGKDIIVTAQKTPGSVDTEVPPDLVLNADAVESYGVSNAAELVAALSTQTRSGRGRGGGAPVVLVNGRRVSGFAEIRDLPPEAIARVETFPEEVALRYGFSADQRVINFILKPNYDAITAEVEYGVAAKGARTLSELQAGYLRIGDKGRINLNLEYEGATQVSEAERGIVQPVAGLADARSLLPRTGTWDANGVISRTLGKESQATLNLNYDRETSKSNFGLANDGISRLMRDRVSQAANAGLSVDGRLGRWRWTATGTYGFDRVRTLTDTVAGPATPADVARSRLSTANANLLLTGGLVRLPAGPVTASFRVGHERRAFRSRSSRGGIRQSAALTRGDTSARASLDIPLASRNRDVAAALGDVSINVNAGYRRLSDFGSIRSFGYGFNWEPASGLNVSASLAAEEAAPSQQQLGDPLVFTPNVTVFDFVRGQTAIIRQISGGNPLLATEDRRDVKLALRWQPKSLEGLNLSTEFYRNRATNPISAFPVLTPAIEAAFPGRVVRDVTGGLASLDVRAINYAASRSDELRFGLNFGKAIGPQPPGAGPPGGRRPGGTGVGGGGGRFGGGPGKRLQASLTYTAKLSDEINIAPGVAALDLLNGGATGSFGGTPGHKIDLEGGWFDNGLGIRAIAAWQSGSTVRDGAGQNLRFSPIGTLNLRFFFNTSQRKKLVEAVPFLKGARLFVRVDNVFNAIRDVRDDRGLTPFRFQPGYVDPAGRSVVAGFRKIF